MTAPALVMRLVEDAEAAVGAGNRAVALRLATLALDFSGPSLDGSLFWRVVGIRDTALAANPPVEATPERDSIAISLPDLPLDAIPREETVFGGVPAESPFGEDGPILPKQRYFNNPAPQVITRGRSLGREISLDTLPEAPSPGNGLLFGTCAALLITIGLAFALPLESGRLLNRLGWQAGAYFLMEYAAGSLSKSTEAHATLGEWHLERGDAAMAAHHYRISAQMGLPWARVPQIVARLKNAGEPVGASEVLLAAFGAGAPKEAWPAIIQELQLLGRSVEANNLRQMLDTRR